MKCSSPNSSNRTATHGGFTLIELLAVIAIIGILFTLGFYANGAIGLARDKMLDRTNLSTLHKATALYAADNNGRMPVGDAGSASGRGLIWINFIAPYIENAEVEDEKLTDVTMEDFLDVLSSPALDYEEVQERIEGSTVDTILGYGYNVYPLARDGSRGAPLAEWDGDPSKQSALVIKMSAVKHQTNRVLFGNAYDWHLAGRGTAGSSFDRAYDMWGDMDDASAHVVFYDGHVEAVTREIYDLAVDKPELLISRGE
ncbi:MAG: type II secretion system protein [Opitutales bacterium]